jgi:hypothetical protein
VVALVAAVTSYRHMRALLLAYGEDSVTATIQPLSVDGLMLVASLALMALGTRSVRVPRVEHVEQPATVPVLVSAHRPAQRPVPVMNGSRGPAPAGMTPIDLRSVLTTEGTSR